MKHIFHKVIWTMAILLCVTVSWAQDVIVTTDAKKIEAKILEVSKSGIKYKESDNPDGPTFILSVDEISSVIYSNGKVVLYNEQAKSNKDTVPAKTQVVTEQATKEAGSRIYRDKGHYLYNDVYISSKEVARILQRENSKAYRQWKKADRLVIGGGICVGIGGGLVLGGIFPLIRGQYMTSLGLECAALVPLGIGLGLTLGASSRYDKAIDIYNSRYDNAAIQLKWRIEPGGLGLAIAF